MSKNKDKQDRSRTANEDGRTQGESGSRQMQGEKLHGDKLRAASEREAGQMGGTVANGKVQGEGDYDAARRYRDDVEHFVESEGEAGIAKKGKKAAKALDGPEGEELRKAEQKGEARARR